MGKQGPCCHCGIAMTPLWRNGPADKPVLCNACGSRWRTKGSLLNYMPSHAGGPGLKGGSSKKDPQKRSEQNPQKRKEPADRFLELHQGSSYSTGNAVDEDCSTWSSAASGISFSESCAQYGVTPARASESWPPWGSHVPSKRRSIMRPFAKRLCFPLPSSDPFPCKNFPKDDLLVDCRPSMTAEIGLGGVLIRPTASSVFPAAQESQPSSFFLSDYKEPDHLGALRSDITREESLKWELSDQSRRPKAKEKAKQLTKSNGAGCTRETVTYNRHEVLQSGHAPLVAVDMKIMQGKEYARKGPKDLNGLDSDYLSSSTTKSSLADLCGSGSDLEKDRERAASRQRHFVKGIGNERESTRFINTRALSRSRGRKSWKLREEQAPLYGLLDHEVLLNLPSTFSFEQAELLSMPASHSSLPPRGTASGPDQGSKEKDYTLIPNLSSTRADVDWSADLLNSPSTGSVNE